MSRWTQVLATVKMKSTRTIGRDIKKILGEPMLFPDIETKLSQSVEERINFRKDWEEHFERTSDYKYIPMGSEGSLNYHIIKKGKKDESYVVIDGYLRDFGGQEDINYIIKWFSRCLNDLEDKTYVVDATISIRDSYDSKCLVYECWNDKLIDTTKVRKLLL